ncbi:histidine kinase [Solwaraspora sp. WMMB335]|uniref:sensor histidine kinase n=1 Tax=Solwaraspora sp. WMMB335 TaxID=3404118 RepID=UPI003B92C6F4
MFEWRDWPLPVLLAFGQFATWPGMTLLAGDRPPAVAVAVSGTATVVVSAALLWRRPHPYRSTAVAVTALRCAMALVPTGALTVLSFAELIALYSVGAHRRLGGAVTVTVFVTIGSAGTTVLGHGLTGETLGGVLVDVLTFLLAVGLGRGRQRWRTGRRRAAGHLAAARAAREQAAARERHRLACELHDVSAHHLTGIVVTVNAARRLACQRPELVDEALRFAADAARQTSGTLRQLVGVLRHGDPVEAALGSRLTELVDGFRRLGTPVTLTAAGPATDVAGDLVFACVREALTNAVRYAPGAAARVGTAVQGGHLVVTVVNDPGRGESDDAVTGSGGGLAGIRARARSCGGELDAGATPAGGWQVCLTLPAPAGPGADRRTTGYRAELADVTVALLATTIPVAAAVLDTQTRRAAEVDPPAAAVLAVLAMVHASPLLWRRRAPWWTLAATGAGCLLWPVALHTELLPTELLAVMLLGHLAEVVAVYTVASRTSTRTSWLAVPAAALAIGVSAAVGFAADPAVGAPAATPAPRAAHLLAIGLVAVVFAVPAGMLLAAVWVVGTVLRRRRGRVLRGERSAVLSATVAAESIAYAARRQIATRLSEAVLPLAGEVALVADRRDDGDPAEHLALVAATARQALAAMRDLLVDLRGETDAEHLPVPTVAALAALCAAYRAAGRPVATDLPTEPVGLPAALDVSAYRLVETALAAGDTGPAWVRLAAPPGAGVYLQVRGVPSAVRGTPAAVLRARTVALGGEFTAQAGGTVQIWLPQPPSPVAREVTSSRSG